MGAAVLAQAMYTSGGSVASLSVRQRCELMRGQGETERQSFITHWRELNDYILPRRGRFWLTDNNKGDRRSGRIFNGTATLAAGTLSAGLQSSVTNGARPWFNLATPDAELNENDAVKAWLFEVNHRMQEAFLRSNLYDSLAIVYQDLGVFGTAAMMELEDDEQIFRFQPFSIGEYWIYNDNKNRVRMFGRTFRLTVDQVVKQWGNIDASGRPDFLRGEHSTISTMVQNLYRSGAIGLWIEVAHMIQQNVSYDSQKISPKYKAFENVYYEIGAPGSGAGEYLELGVLEHSGYDEFPVFCPRWSVSPGDVYATNCPGMTALGDIKELQVRTKRTAQAEEKMLNPPVLAEPGMRASKVSVLPGDITWGSTRDGGAAKPMYEINFGSSFAAMAAKCQQIEGRIERTFSADLFRMLSSMEPDGRMTATEVQERKEEKLLALGPLLGRLDQDMLDPLITRSFNIMMRKNLFPPPPPELQGVTLHVEYLSILAQALKTAGVSALDRFAGFTGQLSQVDPSVMDVVDNDELVRTYSDSLGIPPKVLRSEDAVAQLRQARQQSQSQQQAAENAPGLAGAAKDLSQASTTGNSVLSNLVQKAAGRRTLAATAGPVQ